MKKFEKKFEKSWKKLKKVINTKLKEKKERTNVEKIWKNLNVFFKLTKLKKVEIFFNLEKSCLTTLGWTVL